MLCAGDRKNVHNFKSVDIKYIPNILIALLLNAINYKSLFSDLSLRIYLTADIFLLEKLIFLQ